MSGAHAADDFHWRTVRWHRSVEGAAMNLDRGKNLSNGRRNMCNGRTPSDIALLYIGHGCISQEMHIPSTGLLNRTRDRWS